MENRKFNYGYDGSSLLSYLLHSNSPIIILNLKTITALKHS